jgi:hypothetical protein
MRMCIWVSAGLLLWSCTERFLSAFGMTAGGVENGPAAGGPLEDGGQAADAT